MRSQMLLTFQHCDDAPKQKSHVVLPSFGSCLGHQTKSENSRVTFKLRATQSHQRRPGALSQSFPKNARTMSNQRRFAFFRLLRKMMSRAEKRASNKKYLCARSTLKRKKNRLAQKRFHFFSTLALCRPTCDSITWLRAAHSRAPLLFTVI